MNTYQNHVVRTTPRLGDLAEVFPCNQDDIETYLDKDVSVSGQGWGARRATLVIAQESGVAVDLRLEDGTVYTGATVLSYGERQYKSATIPNTSYFGDVVVRTDDTVRSIDYGRIVEVSLDAAARVGLWAADAATADI